MDKFLATVGVFDLLIFFGMALVIYGLRIDLEAQTQKNIEQKREINKLTRKIADIDEKVRLSFVEHGKSTERVSVLEESVDSKSKRWARIKKVREAIEATTHDSPPILELTSIASAVVDYSDEYDISLSLILGTIKRESNFQRRAISHANAHGLMQVMPETAKEIAGDVGKRHYHLFNIRNNIQFGSYYLRKMLDTFDGREDLAIRAYNCGPVCVSRVEADEWGQFTCEHGKEDYPCETVEYLIAVQQWKERYEEMGL